MPVIDYSLFSFKALLYNGLQDRGEKRLGAISRMCCRKLSPLASHCDTISHKALCGKSLAYAAKRHFVCRRLSTRISKSDIVRKADIFLFWPLPDTEQRTTGLPSSGLPE